MTTFLTLLKNLPLILGLLKSIELAIEEAETDKTVADHIEVVKEAFDKKDATALNNLFNE